MKINIGINEKNYWYQAVVREGLEEEEQMKSPLSDLEISLQIDGQRTREEIRTAFIPAKDMLTHAGMENDYIQHEDQEISFQNEAEGLKKLSVLWRLVATGLIEKGTILFWDEPEANINPKYIPELAGTFLSDADFLIETSDFLQKNNLFLR